MERQQQPDRHATHDPTHIQRFHARHNDGQRRDDQHLPGVILVHAYTDLRLRQCDRDDSYEDNVHLRFLDASHIPGIA